MNKDADVKKVEPIQFGSIVATDAACGGRLFDTSTGDGSHWKFDLRTVEPDITAIELVRIMGMVMDLPDGMMTRIKADPRLIRHFRRVGPEGI